MRHREVESPAGDTQLGSGRAGIWTKLRGANILAKGWREAGDLELLPNPDCDTPEPPHQHRRPAPCAPRLSPRWKVLVGARRAQR